MFGIPLEWIWLGLFVIFIAIEAASSALLTIWFAGGALVSALLSFSEADITIQVIVFFVVSIALLISTRPILKKYFEKNSHKLKTNVDSLQGKTGIVVKEISDHEFGQVKVDGQIWTAVSENNGESLALNSTVKVVGVSGVKLIVKSR